MIMIDPILTVDWIGFTIKQSNSSEIQKIGFYLFKNFNFNVSKKIKGSDIDEPLFYESANLFSCYFLVVDSKDLKGYWKNDFWQGIVLVFSGDNANYFFNILKTTNFDFTIFDLDRTNLTRIDVNHLIDISTTKESLKEFFNSIIEKTRISNRSFSYKKDPETGFNILTIGNRTSMRYYRIYKIKNSLKFEYEIKKTLAKSFQSDLFSNNLEIFTKAISNEFFNHSNNILILDSMYTSWLIKYSRNLRLKTSKIVSTPLLATFLKGSELISYSCKDSENVFKLFQLVSFIYTLDDFSKPIKYLSDTPYYDLSFPLKDYMEFLGIPNSRYQRNKLKMFFAMLDAIPQDHKIISEIPDLSYRSFIVFPIVSVKRLTKESPWIIYLSVSKEFCTYSYEFIFPLEFLKIKGKHDKIIKLHLIHVICSFNLQKRFDVQTFLDNYPIAPTRKKMIRDHVTYLLMSLKQTSWIKPKFYLVDKEGKQSSTKILVSSDLLNLRYIYLLEK